MHISNQLVAWLEEQAMFGDRYYSGSDETTPGSYESNKSMIKGCEYLGTS
jgi:hypothetical protein